MKRKTTRRSSRQQLRFEQLEHRHLLAAAPVGPEITLLTNFNGAQETRVDSLAILPDGGQVVHANTKTGNTIFAATTADNEPLPTTIPPAWPATYHKGSTTATGRIVNVENIGGFLLAAECDRSTGQEPVACEDRTLINLPSGGSTWDSPSWTDFDVANRDDNSEDGSGTEGLVIWAQSWIGPQSASSYEHRIQARFITNEGTPEPGQTFFVVPGSEVEFGKSHGSPRLAMSGATGAVVVTWLEEDLPYFSHMLPNGQWNRQGVLALQSNGFVLTVDSPAVSMSDNGSFVMAWSESASTTFGVKEKIGIQMFDVNGNPIQKIMIDTSSSVQSWSYVDVDTRRDGSFVVVAVDSSGSNDIVYFDFDAAGNLKSYYGGVNPVQQISNAPGRRTYTIDPNVLPRVNSDSTGVKENVSVEATSGGFIAAWSDHETDVSRPWNVQSRLFSESTTDILGRIGNTGRLWLGSVDLGTVDGQLPMQRIQAPPFPDGNTWGRMLVGDFDGDGLEDVASWSAETGLWWINNGITVQPRGEWSNRVDWINVTVGDFDGDGDDDIAGRVAQSGAWWVSLSNGQNQMINLWFGNWSSRINWVNVLPGDFNGDGRTDIVGRVPGSGALWVAESTGIDFRSTRWGTWSTQPTWQQVRVGDFNNDGRDDLLARISATGVWYVAESQQSSFVTSPWGRWSPNVAWQSVVVGDFNHDGRADVAGRVPSSNSWWVAESTGRSFVTYAWGQWEVGQTYVDIIVGDFSADGRQDIIGRDQNTGEWIVGISSGYSFISYPWGDWATRVDWTNVQPINR